MKRVFSFLGMYLICHMVWAQAQPIRYQVFTDGVPGPTIETADSLGLFQQVNQYLLGYWAEGYLYCSLEGVDSSRVFLHKGEKYLSQSVAISIYDPLQDTMVTEWHDKGQAHKIIKGQLDDYANSGHPFARLSWDSLRANGTEYEGYLTLFPGPAVVYDSLVLLGEVKRGKQFLGRALRMEPGDPYSELGFSQLPKRLERLDYLELNSPPDIAFQNGKATVYLDLKERRTNSFEGVVGLLPGQSADQGLVVTGYLDLQLSNLFRSGKHFGFSWNRFADQSQVLDLDYYHPFFLGSRLFLDLDFHLFKQDTTFLNQSWRLLTGANVGRRSEVFFGYENLTGALISPDESALGRGLADFRARHYQIGWRDIRYDRDLPLKNDLRYFSSFMLGDKRIMKNPSIDEAAYDTLERQTSVVKWQAGMKYLVRLVGASAFFHQMEGQLHFNDQLLDNELARLGGLRSLRGFNENFLFAQHYLLSRFELRQYFEQSSYFMVFYDHLFMAYQGTLSSPLGFGGGLSLNTSNGLFTFAFAMGRSGEVPLDPANTKIHIGYTSTF